MTATDELRRLLDERGKEHRVWPSGLVIWHDEGSWVYEYSPSKGDDDYWGGILHATLRHCTPEQAVEATLGSDLEAENAKLRELVQNLTAENEKLQQGLAIREASEQENFIEYLRQENVDWEDRYRALAAENAKLRELARALDWHIRTDGLCADCPLGLAPDAPYEVMCDVMIEELGIEVDA